MNASAAEEEQRGDEQHEQADDPTLELGADAGEEQHRGHDDRGQHEVVAGLVGLGGRVGQHLGLSVQAVGLSLVAEGWYSGMSKGVPGGTSPSGTDEIQDSKAGLNSSRKRASTNA